MAGERGRKLLDCEDASPSESELDTASLHKSQWPTFQRWRSLTSLEKQWSEASKELGGVKAVKQASLEDLKALSWLPDKVAEAVYAKLAPS